MTVHVYKTEAVVLERRDFGEADRLLTLYTPAQGKIRAIAKGARRTTSRLSGHIELFMHSRMLIAGGRNLDIVTQCELIHSHERLREDLWRTALAYQVVELVNRFSEDRLENYAVWRALLEVLQQLDSHGLETPTAEAAELALRYFELKLLNAAGYRPELRACTVCRNPLEPVQNYYDAASGGAVCPSCAEGQRYFQPLSVEAIKVLRVLQDSDFRLAARLKLTPELFRAIASTTRRHIVYVLEHDLLAAHLVDQLRVKN